MFVKQISIFVENKTGRLAEIMGILAEKDVNVFAMSIADTTDFGILRIIVCNPDVAFKALKDNGLTVKETEVVAVSIENKPGGLCKVLKKLDENDIAVEYLYDFAKKVDDNHATIILRLANQDEAVKLMKKSGIEVIDADRINGLK